MEHKSQRDAYGKALLELGRTNPKVVVLDCDVSKATRTNIFAKEYPDRFFNCGVQEANMMNVAAGLALSGFIPFVSTFAVFAVARTLDQIRNTIAYGQLNVKICATHAGITVGEDGASHQAIEDMAVLRAIPHMTILVPCDYDQTRKAVRAAAAYKGAVYIRMGRATVPCITNENTPFKIGKAAIMREGKEVTIVACGVMVAESLEAVVALQREGIEAEVVNMSSLKPLDEDTLYQSVVKTKAVVVAEEGTIKGGLGDAVCSFVSRHYPVPVELVGLKDTFGESGSPRELLRKYHLDAQAIELAARKVIQRKKEI